MRRYFAAAGLMTLALGVLGASVPVRAGGWDSLRFRRDHYLVGEIARARTVFFAGRLGGSGPLDGRVYYAYLLPSSRDELFGMIDAPMIPADAIRLGALQVEGPLTKSDGYPYGIASLTFTVPDVPSGDYSIGFCDDPCAHESVGWLAWGYIRIVHTPLEGRLLLRRDRAETRVDVLERDLRRTESEMMAVAADLTERLHAARMAIRVAAASPDAGAPAPAPRPMPVEGGGSGWWLGVLAGFAASSVLTWVVSRNARRKRGAGGAMGGTDAGSRVVETRETIGV